MLLSSLYASGRVAILYPYISNNRWLHQMAQFIFHMYGNYPLAKNYSSKRASSRWLSMQDRKIICQAIRYCTAIFGNSKIYIRVFILVCVYVDKQCNSYLLLVAVYSKQTRFWKCNIVLLSKSVDAIYVSVVLMF